MGEKLKVLFLCTGNSCRSQMAEGWAKVLREDDIVPYSAGLKAHGLNPSAIKVMAEAEIDISGQQSKDLDGVKDISFDYVVTVCGHADEYCPIFPGTTKVIHRGFDDPPTLAKDTKDEEEALAHFRRVRDEIGEFIASLHLE
jgi:arsenate reductase